jgi:transcriptional regulator with XRE-family HTH domain
MARKSKLTPATAHTADVLARCGFTDQKLASALQVSRSTLSDWKKTNPEFRDTISNAKSAADAQVIDGLFRRACGFTAEDGTYYPPHPVACSFWLRNRSPETWRDTSRTELSGPDGKPLATTPPLIQLAPAQEDALQRLIADAQARVRLPHLIES